MPNSKFDLLLHPIRTRIIVEVSGGRMTAKDMAETMPDVPQATLYRHIKALAEGGILRVVEENRIRGTVERVYALDRDATDVSPEELSQMTREDFEQVFTLFVTSLLGDFSRYLDSRSEESIDVAADGLKFGKVQLHLTEEEFESLQQQLYGSIETMIANEPSPERKRRIVSVVFIPSSDV